MPLVRALVTQRNFTMYLLLIYDVTVINRESCYFAAPKECSDIVYFLFIVTFMATLKLFQMKQKSYFSYMYNMHTEFYLKKF